jgi:KaiC/GvpD/RAD55 family RecA-like ATPase
MISSDEEEKCNWLEAAKFYESALDSTTLPGLLKAEYMEKIGRCYDLASRQVENPADFTDLRELSVKAYEEAARLFKQPSSVNMGKSTACQALAEYGRSWLAPNASKKKPLLENCLVLGKKAAEAFRETGDSSSLGKIYTDLSFCLYDLYYIVQTYEEKQSIAPEAISIVDEAISILSETKEKNELVNALSIASIESWYFAYFCIKKESENHAKRSVDYSKKALALSKKVSSPYFRAMALWAASWATLCYTEDIETSLEYAKKMLQQASLARDDYLKGRAYEVLGTIKDWLAVSEADPDIKKQRYEEILEYSEEAIRNFKLIRQESETEIGYSFYTTTYAYIAKDFATSRSEKLVLSKKAVEMGEEGLRFAISSGSPQPMMSVLHSLSKAYQYNSKLELGKEEKLHLLRNALEYRKEYVRIGERSCPDTWILGVGLVYAAEIEADLSELEEKTESKFALFDDAFADMETGIGYCNDWLKIRAAPAQVAAVAGYEESYGDMLNRRYLLTNDRTNLLSANKSYNNAAEKYKKASLPTLAAETYWKIAKNLDIDCNYKRAAEKFLDASSWYRIAARRISQLNEFYQDYAIYMKAWSEIQKAKLTHEDAKYAISSKHYQKAANLLNQSKRWKYLSQNFSAWSLLEQAEDLSRKERSSEAIGSLKKANKAYEKSKKTLQEQLDKIDKSDEKAYVTELIQASEQRMEYGNGRIAIEEAKILDKQGDHAASSATYGSAGETFQKIAQGNGQIGKEAQPLFYLCRAWQKMTLAEARNSPELYQEAAQLFDQANKYTFDQSAGFLALAHKSFCKALEAGTIFETTRNEDSYNDTKRYMNRAADYYLKAGFETGSEYAKATQRLFDAYVYMDMAKRETNHENEARYYLMAERVLQISAQSFANAKYLQKRNLVRRLLKKVGEEKDLALSLNQVLHLPVVASSTASFAMLSPREERAVGLERFEHADIQTKLVLHTEDVKVGEEAQLELQIANVGKETVQVTKVENILPEGFHPVNKPADYSFENKDLIIKGKRLDPLQIYETKIALTTSRKGAFEISPKITCIDESGHHIFSAPNPVAINVSSVLLPGRITTGYEDLDELLLGGVPEKYAVVLTSPSCDERELLLKRLLQNAAESGDITFCITTDPGIARDLAEKYQNFYLFICTNRPDSTSQNLPNVFNLKGVEGLTDIDIAITKAFRTLTDSNRSRRVLLGIVSDVLLQHNAVITRKWLSGLISDFKSKGFTILAVFNHRMHQQHDVEAILGLFEGEIRISERETERGRERILRIRKLLNQPYLTNEFPLTKEKLAS